MASTRHDNDGLRKLCGCTRRTWAKCDHPWHFNFKPKGGAPPADWLATPGRDGRPRDPAKWPGYRFSLDVHVGREIRSKTEAEALADEIRTEIRAGRFGTSAPVLAGLTVGQLLDTYTTELLDTRPGGAKINDVYQLNVVRRPVLRLPSGEQRAFAHWLVRDVSPGALELLRAALLPQTRVTHADKRVTRIGGPVAANRGLRCLRTVCNWAVRVGYLEASPFKRGTETVIKLTRELKRTRRLHDGEAERLLPACGAHLRAVIECALETGMRRGEILGLRWADVQLDANEIRLAPASTKTRTGRTVPISARLRAILDMRGADPAGEPHPPSARVFGNEIGQRVGSIKTAWHAACKRATIEGLHFHDLRREAGSRWLDGGVPLQVVRDWLGHTSVAQTSTYLATTLQSQHDAMRRFNAHREALQGIATGGGKGGHTGAPLATTGNGNTPETARIHNTH